MTRSKALYILAALVLLRSLSFGQEIDWQDVVFTSLAPARQGCVLASGYDVIGRGFFLEDCQIAQTLIFPVGYVRDIDFTSNRDGWLVYGRDIAPFRDGKTGEAPKIGNGEWLFVGISFFDVANGCTITSDGNIACTHDAGKTWSTATDDSVVDGVGIAYVSKNVVWATVRSKVNGLTPECREIIRSIDGGARWSSGTDVKKCDLYLNGFVDEMHAWALRSNNQLFLTNDGAKSWSASGYVPAKPDDAFFLTPTAGWLIADRNMYRTMDGGYSWKKIWTAPDYTYVDPKGLLFLNEANGWLKTLDVLYRTNDGGLSWKRVESTNSLQ